MAVKTVLKMGERSLLEKSSIVAQFDTLALDALLNDMWDTMAAENGAGLAAPQIGVNLRVVIFGYEDNSRYPEAPSIPQTILINPTIEVLGEQMEEGWEGCLSVPGMRGLVPRYTEIRYSGFDQKGNLIERMASCNTNVIIWTVFCTHPGSRICVILVSNTNWKPTSS
jgi:peptide deformylase